MRLRDWPPRRIGVIWAIGIAVQLLLLLALSRQQPYEAASWSDGDAGPRADSARAEAPVTRESVRRPSWVVTRIPLDGDTLVRIRRDSSFLLLRTSERGTEMVGISPDVAEAGGRIASSFVGALAEAVGPLLLMVAVSFLLSLTPLLVPLAITLVWSAQRRRYGRD